MNRVLQLHDERSSGVLIAALLFLLLPVIWLISRVEYVPRHGFELVHAQAISGDEPHYLIVINSILFDHDLELQDDYKRVAEGGLEAGLLFRANRVIDHHTIVVDRATLEHERWRRPPFRWKLPDGTYHAWMTTINGRLLPAADVYEVSFHPVAFPALLAAMVAPLRPGKDEVESYVGFAMALLGWLGALVTYLLARRIGLDRWWSLVPVLLLVFASPWLAYSRSLFPEVPIGLALALGLWALAADRPIVAAFCTAVAILMNPAFGLVAVGFAIDLVAARRWRSVLQFLVVIGICTALLLFVNFWTSQTLVLPPLNTAQSRVGSAPFAHARGLMSIPAFFYKTLGSVVSIDHGLMWFAPWTLFAFWSIADARIHSATRYGVVSNMALPCLLSFLLLAIVANLGRGYSPGYCYGPRYWTAFLPWLAVAAGSLIETGASRVRWGMTAVAAMAAVISFPGALRYPHLFSQPFYAALSTRQVETLR